MTTTTKAQERITMSFGVHKNAAAKRVTKKNPQSSKVTTVRIDKRVLREAQKRCGPNQAIVLSKDGSVSIVNKK